MRALVPFILLCATATACRCGPDEPVPVTLRVKNSGRSPMFVNATDGGNGIEIQRNVGGEWFTFAEAPGCACLSCDQVCSTACDCAAPNPQMMKIAANQAEERTWSGVVQVQSNGSCGLLAGPACVNPENAPVDETFRARLCYVLSMATAPSNVDSGVPFSGAFPTEGVICTTKEFAIRDGFVELTPQKGASCTQHSECQGEGELCLGGECTTACPSNNVPQLGAGWQLAVEEVNDQGFFTFETTSEQVTATGTGTVSNVRYDNGTMSLTLKNSGGTGVAQVATPGTYAVAFNEGEIVQVKVVDRSAKSFGQRGIVVRAADGGLLLAADVALGERVLSDADLSPFSVSTDGEILGCAATDCGKQLQSATTFSGGAQPVTISPGESLQVVAAGQAYKVVNVANFTYGKTQCTYGKLTPYAIFNTRQSAP